MQQVVFANDFCLSKMARTSAAVYRMGGLCFLSTKGKKDAFFLKEAASVPAAASSDIPEALSNVQALISTESITSRQAKHALTTLLERRKAEDSLHSSYKKAALGWGGGGGGGGPAATAPLLVLRPPPTGPALAAAAARHLLPPALHLHLRALREVAQRWPGYAPERVLSYGAGPAGAGLVAAGLLWPKSIQLTQCVAASPADRDAARAVLRALDREKGAVAAAAAPPPERRWAGALLPLADRAARGGGGGEEPGYDLVLAPYALGELPGDGERAAAAAALWALVRPGGLLLGLERGSAYGSWVARSLRKLLVEDAESAGLGPAGRALAPCPHSGPCPLGGARPCGFTLRVPPSARAGADGPRTEGFSYAIIGKPPFLETDQWSASRFQATDPTTQSCAGSLSRIIRTPLKRKGHIIFDLCNSDGLVTREILSKGKAKASDIPYLYAAARKSALGGLWTSATSTAAASRGFNEDCSLAAKGPFEEVVDNKGGGGRI